MQTKTLAPIEIDIKAVGDDGTFTGYASVFNEVDLGSDSVQPGAFKKSLEVKSAARVKMLRDHRQDEPIGIWTEIIEDAKGLKVSGKLILETVKGRETHALMKAGALDSMSIGYRAKQHRIDREKGVRLLDEIELHEISVVTFPMLPSATVSSVKHYEQDTLRDIASSLKAAVATLKDPK